MLSLRFLVPALELVRWNEFHDGGVKLTCEQGSHREGFRKPLGYSQAQLSSVRNIPIHVVSKQPTNRIGLYIEKS